MGLGTTKDAIRKSLGPSDNPVRIAFEALAETKPGNPIVVTAPRSEAGKFAVVHPDDEADRIPNSIRNTVDPNPTPTGDRSREPQADNSVGYAIRRFEREAPQNPEVAAIYDSSSGSISSVPSVTRTSSAWHIGTGYRDWDCGCADSPAG